MGVEGYYWRLFTFSEILCEFRGELTKTEGRPPQNLKKNLNIVYLDKILIKYANNIDKGKP